MHRRCIVDCADGTVTDQVTRIRTVHLHGKIVHHRFGHIVNRIAAAKQAGPFGNLHPNHIGLASVGQRSAQHVQFHIVRAGDVAVICYVRIKIQVRHQVGNIDVI